MLRIIESHCSAFYPDHVPVVVLLYPYHCRRKGSSIKIQSSVFISLVVVV